MKIAFVISSFPTLSETFILSQIVSLLDRGIHVDIFARGSGDDTVTHQDVDRYDLQTRTFYYGREFQGRPDRYPIRVFNALKYLGYRIRRNPLPLLRSLNFIKFGRQAGTLSLFYKVRRLMDLRIDSYDIIHCHFGDVGREIVQLKRIGLTSARIVTTFYGWDCSSYVLKYGKKVYDDLFRFGDLVLCLSEEMKDRLRGLGCPEEKIVIHHLGIDTDRFQPENSTGGRANGTVNLLTIGRMVEKKGIAYALQAVSKLIGKYPHIRYTVIGGGPLKNELERLASDLGISRNVHFTGPRDQTEILAAMRVSDIFIAPSVTAVDGDKEGTPTVLMEAQAFGLPVVSTLHSGIPEVVIDGGSGYLVPEKDANSLAEKLSVLIDDSGLRRSMGVAGRNYVGKEYNAALLAGKLEKIYRSLFSLPDNAVFDIERK